MFVRSTWQRSLNASMLKRVWTKDEDTQLCEAVEVLGESDLQSVASTLEKDGLAPNVLIG